MANRAAHLDYVAQTGAVLFGGPLISDGQMCGSLLVIEADDIEAARNWAAHDPYALAGLFADVEISEWKRVIG